MRISFKIVFLSFFFFKGNIFLRSVDLSFNGLGKEGAIALGQALKENSVLEELNVRYGFLLRNIIQEYGSYKVTVASDFWYC